MPIAETAICRNPMSPEAVPAMRGWTLSPAAIAAGWLSPLPIELSAIGTNSDQTLSAAPHHTAISAPEPSEIVSPATNSAVERTRRPSRAAAPLPSI